MCAYLNFQCVAWVWPQSLHCIVLVGENIILLYSYQEQIKGITHDLYCIIILMNYISSAVPLLVCRYTLSYSFGVKMHLSVFYDLISNMPHLLKLCLYGSLSYIHIDMNMYMYTYRKTVPEFESLCLCSEGMDVPACM